MSNKSQLTYQITQDLTWQQHANWQMPDTPFMSHEFWQALTDTKAIGEDTGWIPLYIMVSNVDDKAVNDTPVAVIPVFIKSHHQGEYVFDHAWAEAYNRYGMDYYPRLVTCVPYTPVTGQRMWLAKGITLNTAILDTALQGVDNIAKQVGASSWHGLYVNEPFDNAALPINTKAITPDEIDSRLHQASQFNQQENQQENQQGIDELLDFSGSTMPLLERQGCQFLWQNKNITNDNQPFTDFDDFLATLTAKKRKNIRAERKKVAKQNLTCVLKTGKNITDEDWKVFYQCYAMTYMVRGRAPYLSAEFFNQIGQSMPQHLMLAQGLDETGNVIASSLFFYDDPSSKNATLYGRYWGSLAEYDSLHFELCYYQGIEFAIAQGLQYFDPGTQGEHKLIRGFVPTKTYSLHRIYDPRFVPAIASFCEQDRAHMQHYRKQAYDALPFNIDNMPDFKG